MREECVGKTTSTPTHVTTPSAPTLKKSSTETPVEASKIDSEEFPTESPVKEDSPVAAPDSADDVTSPPSPSHATDEPSPTPTAGVTALEVSTAVGVAAVAGFLFF